MANTITLATAQAWAGTWRTTPPKPLAKGHLIPLEVLQDLLAIPDVVSVRAYMGVDGTGVQKLMFVGVDETGKDMTSTIWSGTQPCPPLCDLTSPLYTL